MNKRPQYVTLFILGKEYKVVCADKEEEEALLSSARHLDQKMREIRATGKVSDPDRIAVLMALNLNHELNVARSKLPPPESDVTERLVSMRKKIESVLENP